jgi:hypothetical protein
MRRGESGYWLEPVLIANDLVEGVEVSLPKPVLGYRVKLWLDKSRLYILDLAAGDPHGAGVVNLIAQTSAWNSSGVWALRSDSQNSVGGGPNKTSSPDLVIAIPSNYSAPGENLGRIG